MSNLQEWFALIDQEEGEQLVCEIMEEILQKSQQVIFERHIESQVLPYAVKFAKDTLLKMVQVKLLFLYSTTVLSCSGNSLGLMLGQWMC